LHILPCLLSVRTALAQVTRPATLTALSDARREEGHVALLRRSGGTSSDAAQAAARYRAMRFMAILPIKGAICTP
jgi:hypothetical protein